MSMFPLFAPYSNLVATLSEKKDGSCRLPQAVNPEMRPFIRENRARFIKGFGIGEDDIIAAELVHSNTIYLATVGDRGAVIPGTDALITNVPGIFLSVTVADCPPVFLFDPKTNSIGLVHAGWRSLAKNIIPLTIQKMANQLECEPENILAGVGPSIGNCHFEVKEDVLSKFTYFLPVALRQEDGRKYLDLKAIAKRQLETAGILPPHIAVSEACTFDLTEKYFSYRRDKPEILQTMMAIIGIRTK